MNTKDKLHHRYVVYGLSFGRCIGKIGFRYGFRTSVIYHDSMGLSAIKDTRKYVYHLLIPSLANE